MERENEMGGSVLMMRHENRKDGDRTGAEVDGILKAGIVNLENTPPHLLSLCQGQLITNTSGL